jgi:hypothetical protein
MATPPSSTPPSELDRQLERWREAGLIDADQQRRIHDHEARFAPTPGEAAAPRSIAAPASLPRPNGVELLAYLGVGVALAGVLILIHAALTSLWFIGDLTAGIGLAALACGYVFARGAGATALRAAGACLALGAAALGAGAGELSAAAQLFTRTTVYTVPCDVAGSCLGYTTVDHAGNVLVGACVTVAVVIALIRFVPGQLAAVVLVAGAYTAAGATIDLAALQNDPGSHRIAAVIIVVASLALAAVGQALRRRQPAVRGFLDFVGVAAASLPLYVLGGTDNVDLDVGGGLVAGLGVATGIAAGRTGLAYGGVLGLAGLVVDIGVRNFHTASSIGVFLSLCGVAGVAAVVVGNRLVAAQRGARHRGGDAAE